LTTHFRADYLVPDSGIAAARVCIAAGPTGDWGLVLAGLEGAVPEISPCLPEADSSRRGFARAGGRARHVCPGIAGGIGRRFRGHRCRRCVGAGRDARAVSSSGVVWRSQLMMMTAGWHSDLLLRQLRSQSPDAEEPAPSSERPLAVLPRRSLSQHALRGAVHPAFRPPLWRKYA